MEDYIVRLARTIEKADAPRPMTVPEAKKDISPIEARQVDTPEMENVLEEYPAQLETQNLETFNWDTSAVRLQLRQLYMLGPDGQPVPDAANYNKPMTKGKGTMAELMDQLFERAKAQQATLNSTRAALAEIRGKLESAISEYNKLKPDARLLKMTEEELKQKITQLGQEKETLEEQVTKLKSRVEEQTGEITSLKDEVSTAKDETEAAKEENAALEKKIKQLQKLMQQMAQQQNQASGAASGGQGGTALTSLPAGEKGKISAVDNKLMFCVIEFTDEAMKEMLGPERQGALPALKLGIRRKGFKGPAGEFVGKVALRQSVSGKNFVIADILGDWSQAPVEKGDVIFSE
jgi:archaellum component FlaC